MLKLALEKELDAHQGSVWARFGVLGTGLGMKVKMLVNFVLNNGRSEG